MTSKTGRNRNTNDAPVTTTVTINSTTATTLVAPNDDRLYIRISLDSGTTDAECFIREYGASVDNNKAGEILVRKSIPDTFYKPMYLSFPDNIYTGEISAIAVSGSFDLHITEG